MSKSKRRSDIAVGLFVTLGAFALVVTVFILGSERRLFEQAVHLRARFPNVAGLKVGAQVLLAGVNVGHVSRIEFPSLEQTATAEEKQITVEFRVSGEVLSRIRADSVARVDSMGLLGDKTINLSLGSVHAGELHDGDTMRSVAPPDLNDYVGQADAVFDNVVSSSDQLRALLEGFVSGGGDEALAGAARSLQNLLEEVEDGNGFIHTLIYDGKPARDVTATVASLRQSAAKLDASLAKLDDAIGEIKNGEGLVHTAIYGKDGAKTVAAANTVLTEVGSVVRGVREGPGLVHNLIYAEDNGTFIKNLNAASADIKTITADVKSGRGTLGALVTDPSVYEDLKVLMGNVRRSDALRTLVRLAIEQKEADAAKAAAR